MSLSKDKQVDIIEICTLTYFLTLYPDICFF